MISVSNLCKKFGDKLALNNLNVEIHPGDIVGFLGPNGAGKSTTMKMLSGFLAISSGKVEINGLDVAKHATAVQQLIGYLPEGAPAYGEMSVFSFLHFIASVRKIKKGYRTAAIKKVVKALSLEAVLDKPISTLSKGFKCRVGLAQALIHDPQILILDEPSDGLDPNQKHQVRQLIQALSKDKIIIIATHNLDEVTALCNRVLIIAEGVKKFDGTPLALQQESKYHNAVALKFSYAADVSGILELSGVADIKHDPRDGSLIVLAEKGANIIGVLSTHIQQRNLPVENMHHHQGKLDEVFRLVTSATYSYKAPSACKPQETCL